MSFSDLYCFFSTGQKSFFVTILRFWSTFYLFQSISIAIQRGNAACIIGTAPSSEGLEEVFEMVEHNSEVSS